MGWEIPAGEFINLELEEEFFCATFIILNQYFKID